jgi:GNAT superfamily N-acetyltransferase
VGVEVRAVSGGRELRRFIDLPFRLHANHPQWVPPLRIERRIFLSRRLNAFFRHGEAEYFLAWRTAGSDDAGAARARPVGRISAHIDRAYDDLHEGRWGWFGFLELENDPEVAHALLAASADWLHARGCERMVGPADFTMNDESGLLVEGFDERVLIREPWQPPYYQALLEQDGLEKAVDMLVWRVCAADRYNTLPVIFELAEKVQSEHGIRIRHTSRWRLRRELDNFAEVYNAAWSQNWGFVPYSKEDLDAYAQELQLVFDKDWFFIAEREDTGEVVGLAFTFRDINQVLRKMNGRLLPFGWWHFLRKNKTMNWIRIGFLGVKPEYQHTGVAAKLFIEHFDAADRTGSGDGHCSWLLETNRAINAGMEAMGLHVNKRYRMYERPLTALHSRG